MSALEEAVCPVDRANLHETVTVTPEDDADGPWLDSFVAAGFECPTCLRFYLPDDPRVWVHLTPAAEL